MASKRLKRYVRAWPEAQHSQVQRSLLALQAKQWANQIMRYAEQHGLSPDEVSA